MKKYKAYAVAFAGLVMFTTVLSVQAGTVWKGDIDDNWSTAGNWDAGVPGNPDGYAQLDGTDQGGLIDVDAATTGLQKLQFLVNARDFQINGGPMTFADGQGDVILHSGSNLQTINTDIFIDSSVSAIRNFRTGNYDGQLIINGDVVQNTNGFRFTKGNVTMNGSFSGDKLLFNEGSHTFANTSDNDFNSIAFTSATDVTVNTVASTVFFDGEGIFFNAFGPEITFNNANVLGDHTALTIGNAAHTATLAFNADETLGSVAAVGTFVINLGAGVNTLAFANSSANAWTGGLVVNDFRPGIIRFGTSTNGLSRDQLELISAYEPGGYPVTNQMVLNEDGFLIPGSAGIGQNPDPLSEPSVTMMWDADLYPGLTPAQIKALGVNRVWLNKGTTETVEILQNAELEVQGPLLLAGYSGLNDEQYADQPRTFLPSDPVTAGSNGPLTINLLSGYDTSEFAIENDAFFRPYWKVWDRTDGTALPSSAWTYSSGMLTITDAQSGHEYNAGFSVIRMKIREMQDIFPESFRTAYLQDYIDAFQTDLRDVLRVIGFSFYFYRLNMPDGNFLDWYGPGATIGRGFIEAYESRYAKPFDLDVFMEIGTLRSTNDEWHQGYREMLEIYREMAQSFAPEFNDMVHGQGRKNRFFWGDAWVGVEPQLPAFAEQGFDEITTVVGVPQDVRRLMTVDSSVQRNNRFGLFGVPVGSGTAELNDIWTDFLRGALRTFPEGISLGGPEISLMLQNEPGFESTLAERIADFRFLHGKIHDRKAFEHDITVGILNSYGKARAWPRQFTVNDSQAIWHGLADSPLKVEWLDFSDINGGVPSEIDVLINAGEPGSAWSGGVEWTPAAVAAVESFVQNGGAFIGIDAPGVNNGTCVLDDVLGLDFAGTASAAAAAGIFSAQDPERNFLNSNPSEANFSLMLSWSAANDLGTPQFIGNATANSVMTAVSPALQRLDNGIGDISFTKHPFGSGTAWYVRNIPTNENGYDFLKRLIHEAAGRPGLLTKLYCRTNGGFVYYYPFERLLIAYNQNSSATTLDLDLGLFVGYDEVEFNGLNAHAANQSHAGSALGAGPLSVSLDAESFAVWEVSGSYADQDGDEIPDYWELAYSGSETGLVATVDGDDDGRNNLQEYLADTSPINSASLFRIERIETGPNPKLVFNGSTNRFFQMFYSTDGLADPAFRWIAGDWVRGNGPETVFDISVTNRPSMFFRLDARVP